VSDYARKKSEMHLTSLVFAIVRVLKSSW